jgi:hypothetical protein
LLHTSLKMKHKNFPSVTNMFITASPDAIHRVLEWTI